MGTSESNFGSAWAGLGGALGAPPTLGNTHFLVIDGPAGSGKSTLAQALGKAAAAHFGEPGDVVVLNIDDLLRGWGGLGPELWARTSRQVLDPLARGENARYQRWDWELSQFADWIEFAPPRLLILEGCTAGAPEIADRAGLLFWVEARLDLRLQRGLARDGEAMRAHWLAWQVEESEIFARHQTRQRAKLVLQTG